MIEDIIKAVIIPISLMISIAIYIIWPETPQDTIIEEVIEKIIETQTGIDVDLTPETPENTPTRYSYDSGSDEEIESFWENRNNGDTE